MTLARRQQEADIDKALIARTTTTSGVPGARPATLTPPMPSDWYEQRPATEYDWRDVLRLADITSVHRTIYATTDGLLWASTRVQDQKRGAEYMRFGYSFVYEDDDHFPAVLEPVAKDAVVASIEAMLRKEATVRAGDVARDRAARPVSKDWTLSSLLAMFERDHIAVAQRGGKVVLGFPKGGRVILSVDLRHAIDVYADLLAAHAAGKPVTCDEPKCSRPADVILFPRLAVCEAHSELTIAPVEEVQPMPWWEAVVANGRLVITPTPAGCDVLGLPQPPDDHPIRRTKAWRAKKNGILDRLRQATAPKPPADEEAKPAVM